MAYPNDIFLPANSKEFGFVDSKYDYNGHWDIVWSFTFALTGTEHAFATFLTTNPNLSTGNAGQYLGYFTISPPIQNGRLVIAFDSTGLFALPISGNPGVALSAVKHDALIIRDEDNNVIFNEALSSLSTDFFLASANKNYQTLRFRFSNAGRKLSIDYKKERTEYQTLTSVTINFDLSAYPILYPALTFCSPISSLTTPSTMYIKNFHTQGSVESPTYESLSSLSLSVFVPTTFTTLSAISAFRNPYPVIV
jgi:hypothetical protein